MPLSVEAKRACDHCRKRKIKCDRADPCSFCRISSRPCSYDSPIGKRGPKGPRLRDRRRVRRLDGSEELVVAANNPVKSEPLGGGFHALVRLRDNLAESVRVEVPSVPLITIIRRCISLYFRRSFPILHQASLHSNAVYFFGSEDHDSLPSLDGVQDAEHLALMRAFAVLTAFCAALSFLYGRSAMPYGGAVAPTFLIAARQMLREYEDDDLREPDATSLQVRMLLSTSLQLHSGDTGLAWHLVGEAGLIARRMRLYSESIVSQYSPLEAAMLRNAFWSLYTADASSECMQNRALVLYEPLFDTDLDLLETGRAHVPLIETDIAGESDQFETRVSRTFHQIRRTWSSAARLMRAIRAFGRRAPNIDPALSTDPQQIVAIANMYAEFTASLDNIPPELQPPAVYGQGDSTISDEERPCYVSKRYRLLSAYFYTKLLIIHVCRHLGLAAVVGFCNDNAVLAGEEVNVARDFIHNLQSVPFHHLVELGEPEVEITRAVGSVLLAVGQGSNNVTIRQRAGAQLNILVDILARMDSQASEKLALQLSRGEQWALQV
ncbi:hypothetical protein BJY04DRAFT_220149 [Aspergillus karnatakaensis]|uniref:uncharacterized protein n=1 Tax=Aspergillus karnatakaensis TaxID=1810916 RepID=UPI003CCD49AF